LFAQILFTLHPVLRNQSTDLSGFATLATEFLANIRDGHTAIAFYLWKMGATIVGVPSSQAPNTFMEAAPFRLPYTQLNGTISNSMQILLPATDARAKTFWPDMMPSYDDYLRYHFDLNTEPLWLLDKIKPME
jgi:hypothetical protein